MFCNFCSCLQTLCNNRGRYYLQLYSHMIDALWTIHKLKAFIEVSRFTSLLYDSDNMTASKTKSYFYTAFT